MTEFRSFAWRSSVASERLRRSSQTATGRPASRTRTSKITRPRERDPVAGMAAGIFRTPDDVSAGSAAQRRRRQFIAIIADSRPQKSSIGIQVLQAEPQMVRLRNSVNSLQLAEYPVIAGLYRHAIPIGTLPWLSSSSRNSTLFYFFTASPSSF